MYPATPRPFAPMTEMSAELWNSAARVLETNWSGDHMVPSRSLYPHQWSWDTAFIAIGLVDKVGFTGSSAVGAEIGHTSK